MNRRLEYKLYVVNRTRRISGVFYLFLGSSTISKWIAARNKVAGMSSITRAFDILD